MYFVLKIRDYLLPHFKEFVNIRPSYKKGGFSFFIFNFSKINVIDPIVLRKTSWIVKDNIQLLTFNSKTYLTLKRNRLICNVYPLSFKVFKQVFKFIKQVRKKENIITQEFINCLIKYLHLRTIEFCVYPNQPTKNCFLYEKKDNLFISYAALRVIASELRYGCVYLAKLLCKIGLATRNEKNEISYFMFLNKKTHRMVKLTLPQHIYELLFL